MKVERALPPNYTQIITRFPSVKDSDNVVFTYGDTLYAPHLPETEEIPDHLMKHEETHTVQQGNDVDAWWTKYLADSRFRLSQEVEAYHNQYMFIKETYGSNNAKRVLFYLALDLCGPMYDLEINYLKAEMMIKKGL